MTLSSQIHSMGFTCAFVRYARGVMYILIMNTSGLMSRRVLASEPIKRRELVMSMLIQRIDESSDLMRQR